MSKIRRVYFIKLAIRIAILLASILIYFYAPEQFDIVDSLRFFEIFSVFHILWVIWVLEMITQLFPAKNIALGSQKFSKEKFRPILHKLFDWDKLKDYIDKTNKAAGKAMALCLSQLSVL